MRLTRARTMLKSFRILPIIPPCKILVFIHNYKPTELMKHDQKCGSTLPIAEILSVKNCVGRGLNGFQIK